MPVTFVHIFTSFSQRERVFFSSLHVHKFIPHFLRIGTFQLAGDWLFLSILLRATIPVRKNIEHPYQAWDGL